MRKSKDTCHCTLRHVGPCPSAEIKLRTPEAIGQDYGRVAMEIGDLVYRRDVGIPKALEELYARAQQLNLEAAEAAKETASHG